MIQLTPSWPNGISVVLPPCGSTLTIDDGGSVVLIARRPIQTAPSPVATTTASPEPTARSACSAPVAGSIRTTRACGPLVTHSEPKPAAIDVVPPFHGSLIVRGLPFPVAGSPISCPVRVLPTHTRPRA